MTAKLMKRHLHLWIFLCCLCCFLNGFAQSEHPEHTLPTKPVQTPDHSLIHNNSLHPERPEMNPRSVVALPQPDTLAFSFQRSYTLTPWMNKPQLFTTLNQPYVMDYISMTRLGAWHAITSSTSYPLWGTARDVQFFYPQQLLPRLYLYGGAAAIQYNFGGHLQTDFGAAAGLYYTPFDKLGFNLYYQHSFRQDIMHLNPTLTPMLWQNRVGFDVEFKPSENVKFRIGIQKDTGHGMLRH